LMITFIGFKEKKLLNMLDTRPLYIDSAGSTSGL